MEFFLSGVAILWPVAVAGVFLASYTGLPPTQALSFHVTDGWCETGAQGIGSHCFGDFGLPYGQWRDADGPYTDGNIAASSTPLTLFVFKFLALFPYNVALSLYLLSLALPLVAVMGVLARRVSFLSKATIVVFGGLLTTGLLVAIDRGNHVAWMAPLLIVLVAAKRPWIIVATLTLLISLKFWGILFVLLMLARGQWRLAAAAVLGAILLNGTALIVLSENPMRSAKITLDVVLGSEIPSMVEFYSISGVGMIKKVACAIGPNSLCPVSPEYSRSAILLVSIALLIALCAMAFRLLRRDGLPLWIQVAALISLVLLGLPESGAYNLVLVTAIPAAIMLMPSDEPMADLSYSQRQQVPVICGTAVMLACVMTTVPWFLSWSVRVGTEDVLVSAPLVVSPVAWGLAALAMAYMALRPLARPPASGSPSNAGRLEVDVDARLASSPQLGDFDSPSK